MRNDTVEIPVKLSNRQMIRHWFGETLGRYILDLEISSVKQVLPDIFGYHILQVGCLTGENFLTGSRISHKVVLQSSEDDGQIDSNRFICLSDVMSLASDSVDVVVMPHMLEFAENPHKVLREVERILIGEGQVIILGFNPWSFMGLYRLILAWRETPPWSGHFFGLYRLKDWLSLLDFEILLIERFFFRPPIKNVRIMQRLKFLEKLGHYCWPYFGGAFMIVAKKRVLPMTPIKMRWSARRKIISSGIAEPSTPSR